MTYKKVGGSTNKLGKVFKDLIKKFSIIKKAKFVLQNQKLLKELNGGLLKGEEDLSEDSQLKKFSAEIKFLKEKGLVGIKAAIKAAGEVEKQIGDLYGKAEGKSITEGDVKITFPKGAKDLLTNLQVMIAANLISQSDFKLSAGLKKEMGKFAVELQSSLTGFAKFHAKMQASAKFFDFKNGTILNILLKAEVGFTLNLKAAVEGSLSLEDKVKLTAGITGEMTITGNAKAEANAKLTIKSVVAKVDASAKAEAKATVKAIVGAFTVGGVGLEGELGVEGEAKAEAMAAGEFTLDPQNGEIVISGKVSSLAQAGAFAFTKVGVKCKDKMIASTKVKVGVTAGVGGAAGGAFAVKNGKLVITVDLAAAFEGGVDGSIEIEIDLKSAGNIIVGQIKEKAELWKKVNVKDDKIYFALDDSGEIPLDEIDYMKIKVDLKKEIEPLLNSKKFKSLRTDITKEAKGQKQLQDSINKGMKLALKNKAQFLSKKHLEDPEISERLDEMIAELIEREGYYPSVKGQKIEKGIWDGWKVFE